MFLEMSYTKAVRIWRSFGDMVIGKYSVAVVEIVRSTIEDSSPGKLGSPFKAPFQAAFDKPAKVQ
ncbi:MAG: hypothetical protein QG663_1166 [Thermodesulfobacteriota bacterium]|nr:hypothetical protein [Thermodesulfobacteriota bacterium]